jgi:uncharacterized protein YwgA
MNNVLSENQKYLLDVVSSFNESAGTTKIVKAIFLEHAMNKNTKYLFIRWYYGPYAKEIITDLDYLVNAGFVNKKIKNSFPEYEVTNKKSEKYCRITDFVSAETKVNLKSFLKKLYDQFDIPSYDMGREILFTDKLEAASISFLNT